MPPRGSLKNVSLRDTGLDSITRVDKLSSRRNLMDRSIPLAVYASLGIWLNTILMGPDWRPFKVAAEASTARSLF